MGCLACDGSNDIFTDLGNGHCPFDSVAFKPKNLWLILCNGARELECRPHALNFDQELNFDNGSHDSCMRPVVKYRTAYRLLRFSRHFDNQRTRCCLSQRSHSHPIKPKA